MITINLKEIINQKSTSLKTLSEDTGLRYATVWALANNKTKGIEFRVLSSICNALNCEPKDIMIYSPDKEEQN